MLVFTCGFLLCLYSLFNGGPVWNQFRLHLNPQTGSPIKSRWALKEKWTHTEKHTHTHTPLKAHTQTPAHSNVLSNVFYTLSLNFQGTKFVFGAVAWYFSPQPKSLIRMWNWNSFTSKFERSSDLANKPLNDRLSDDRNTNSISYGILNIGGGELEARK